MTHIAINEIGDDGSSAVVGDHVTDGEYAAAPEIRTLPVMPGYVVTAPGGTG